MAKPKTEILTVIELEDKGQDFLEFYVNKRNVIVETKPFQGWVWNGMRISPRPVRSGMLLTLFKPGKRKGLQLRYRVIGTKKIRCAATPVQHKTEKSS